MQVLGETQTKLDNRERGRGLTAGSEHRGTGDKKIFGPPHATICVNDTFPRTAAHARASHLMPGRACRRAQRSPALERQWPLQNVGIDL